MKRNSTPFIYHPIYSDLVLPPRHRYPIGKYRALQQWAVRHGAKPEQWLTAQPLNWDKVATVHCRNYIRRLQNNDFTKAEWRRIGFPWSQQLLTRTLTSAGGTLQTVEVALQQQLAIHFSGGYHHAHYDWGSGFCLINDLAIAARHAVDNLGLSSVLIFDTDVHQGDGTATLFSNESRIITCSIHSQKNFPFNKAQSDIDVGVADDISEADYLQTVFDTLESAINRFQPQLVLYDAGVDIYQRDDLGKLGISLAGIYQRDLQVLGLLQQRQIATAVVIGGGYQRQLDRLVTAHGQLLRAAHHLFSA
ncbi:histone deacetylase [Idiomarina tyrosinivorans]|uniref:Histone deacetylase n=1 Tax=Idiomarina tyrosinivorans TaxID=1445662 RepID=A0A432ZLC4_9GAMM|nr:histone deacetylase [Idiomarina tyrosinivorans]RUO78776.1 histone deacetylase [Idiomarina tyrosinivorans]